MDNLDIFIIPSTPSPKTTQEYATPSAKVNTNFSKARKRKKSFQCIACSRIWFLLCPPTMNTAAATIKLWKIARFFGVTPELLDCSIWSHPLWIKFKTFRENIKYAGLVDNYVGNKGQHTNRNPKILKILGCGGGGVAGTGENNRNKARLQIGCKNPPLFLWKRRYLTAIMALHVCLLTCKKQNHYLCLCLMNVREHYIMEEIGENEQGRSQRNENRTTDVIMKPEIKKGDKASAIGKNLVGNGTSYKAT